jgi:hypothetical protein
MAHAVVTNTQLIATNEYFQCVWKLTRTMLAAGWTYKASADATGVSTNKDTTANPANDKWAVGGGVNLTQVGAQTGTNPSIGAASSGLSVITSVSGFVANSVGRFLQITGAVNANNNGVFRITAQTGTTVTVFNPGAVAESGTNITWKEMQGGSAASIFAAGTGGATPKRAIVSGLTGMVATTSNPLVRGSVGDHLTIIGAATGANNGTFKITRVISATSVEIENSSATTDANNGTLIWVESSPLAQTYPVSLQGATGQGAWTVLQGPSTLKIPVGTNVPTGTFVRQEVVTQTSSGATGTLLGILTDATGGQGYAVIAPRLDGTGGGVHGWTTGGTDTLTGGTSGATITTANITPIEFIREIVFWKSTALLGHCYIQCIDQSAESTYRFSTIAANAAVTNVLAPGSNASVGFSPYGTYAQLGTGNTSSVSTGAFNWFNDSSLGVAGNVQIMCANAIALSTTDGDGSYIVALGQPATLNSAYAPIVYMRCDDSEEGDVDPYVAYAPTVSSYDGARTTSVTNNGANDGFNQTILGTGTSTFWKGYRRRGFSTGDAFQQFQGHQIGKASVFSQAVGIGRVTHSVQEQMIREPVWMISTQFGQRMRKGTLRWLAITEGGVSSMTYNSGQYVQLSGGSNNSVLVAGPWDGATVASNA